ncbi:hypothetical protein [Ruminococcus sp. HUN007]|uniref:hypothetical protein n=1 Tax=Ruminococcus sp. HUN007 TaxID=1514668 RepID=UPI0006795B64|nr:hypothetical protein [Ruminococcus sp. HUN007]
MKNENVRKVLKLSLAAIAILVVLKLAFLLLNGFSGFGNDNELQSQDDIIPGYVTEAVTEPALQILTDSETDAATAEQDTETVSLSEDVFPVSETVTEQDVQTEAEAGSEEPEEFSGEVSEGQKYVFRNSKLLNDHYKKHGEEMGFASAEEYEKAASDVVNSPDALHKKEKDDNDDVYYIEDTNEFVVVSSDGYLRTYFKPDRGRAYYDRQ